MSNVLVYEGIGIKQDKNIVSVRLPSEETAKGFMTFLIKTFEVVKNEDDVLEWIQ